MFPYYFPSIIKLNIDYNERRLAGWSKPTDIIGSLLKMRLPMTGQGGWWVGFCDRP